MAFPLVRTERDVNRLANETAVASNAIKPTTGPDLRDPDLERAPGLRYSDKDKPL